jgi:transposase-like protein
MAQHFLYSAQARSLSLAQIFRLSDQEAFDLLKSIRWEGSEPVCPHCGNCEVYEITTRRIFKCKARECRKQFSLTSGTIFASHKLPLRDYLAAIAIFVNGAKGVSALQLGRDLDISYKSAFVLAHKLREAMAADEIETLSGVVEIDGSYYGGFIKPENIKAERIDRRRQRNKTGKRKAVVVARERGGRTATAVFPHETDGVPFIISRVAPGSTVHSDEGRSWDCLHDHYEMKRINHQIAYSLVACTNQAESYFARLRRSEIGVHHYISGPYLDRYAAEMAWREDHRRKDNGEQFRCVATLALANGKSERFARYWQRA